MIVRTSTGKGIRGLHNYVTEGRDAERLGGTGFGFDVDSERREKIALSVMEHDGADSRRIKNPFFHTILSWHPDQSPDHGEQREAARSVLGGLGMPNARSIFYRHNDKPHPHVHIVGSRFDPEAGRFYSVRQSANKGIAWSKEWELEHGIPDSRLKDHGLPPQDDYWKQMDEWAKNGPDLPRLKDVRKLFKQAKREEAQSADETFRRMLKRFSQSHESTSEDRTLATDVGTEAREKYRGMGL